MRWLLRLLSGFFQWPADERAIDASGEVEDGTAPTNEADDRDRTLSPLQQSGGFRTVRRYRIGPPAGEGLTRR